MPTPVHTHTHPGGDIVQATGDNVRQSFDTSVRPALLHPRPPSLLYLKSRQFVRTGSVAVVPAFCNLGGHPPTLLYPLLPPVELTRLRVLLNLQFCALLSQQKSWQISKNRIIGYFIFTFYVFDDLVTNL